jgi:signal transduction histidine kinase
LDNPETLKQGDKVEVEGQAYQGKFSPVVNAHLLSRLGRGSLPKPKKVTFEQLSTGAMDSQFVSVTGVVRSAGIGYGESQLHLFSLRIAMNDGVVDAFFSEDDAPAAAKLVGALVRIDAAAAAIKNQNRQIIAATLSAQSIRNVTVLRPPPEDLFALPLMHLGSVMQYKSGTDYRHPVRIAGVVTYYKPGEDIYLEDNGQSLLVKTRQINTINPGDRVEVVGFPAPRTSGPILEDSLFRRTGSGQPPQPTPVTIAGLSDGNLNNTLVSVKGKLIRCVREPSGYVFLLQSNSDLMLAELDYEGVSDFPPGLREGSSVMITGISILEVKGTWNYGGDSVHAVRCHLLLRSLSDIKTIGPPTWWTIRHMLYISIILGMLAIAFLAQVIYSRVERWRIQAINEEREQLSNEIHDTLAQSFAGIGFQLQAIRKIIPNNMSELRRQVDLARDLARHSHSEARHSIEQLEHGSRVNVDLLSSLADLARTMVQGGSVNVIATSVGNPRHMPPRVENALMRIGQEAIANTVRHADPSNLAILLHYEENVVRLVIQDDGIGFVQSGDLLGFGLRGMRKRAAAISAKLEINSQPKHGTRVVVITPVPAASTLAGLIKRTLRYVSEHTFHVQTKQPSNPDSDC